MADAYVTGLRLLAGRELSEAQLRARLARRQIDSGDIEAAVARLRGEGALDDFRAARACARTEAGRRRGRLRVLRQVQALGVDRDTARRAVAEVFADVDEDDLLARALARRAPRDGPIDQAAARRLERYLRAQGFAADRVSAALRTHMRQLRHEE